MQHAIPGYYERDVIDMGALFSRRQATAVRQSANAFAPDIFRKRLLLEGYFAKEVTEETLLCFLSQITRNLCLCVFAPPVVKIDTGAGSNLVFDAYLPLNGSGAGIHLAVWAKSKFLSLIIFANKNFDDQETVKYTRNFFSIGQTDYKVF